MVCSSVQRQPRQFSHREILRAIRACDSQEPIKVGAHGKVYKAIICNGREKIKVAVKRLNSNSTEFQREINMVSNLHHANVLSLIGYCEHCGDQFLVYEWMPNGSLAHNLYPRHDRLSNWEQCLTMLIGVARGLHYLHSGTSLASKIIHGDVKPGNILLNENWEAKVCDFGFSKSAPANPPNSHVVTTFRGTQGYTDPCFIGDVYRKLTSKVDVYAFGVVLFEVLFGREAPKLTELDGSDLIYNPGPVAWVNENIHNSLKGKTSNSCFDRVREIGIKCQDTRKPSNRPTMSEVVAELEKALELHRYEYVGSPETNHIGSSLYIQGTEDKVVLYYCKTGSRQTCTDYFKLRLYLNTFGVDIEERDPMENQYEDEIHQYFEQIANYYCLPQLFIGGRHVGGCHEVIQLYDSGELEKLLGRYSR